MKLHWQARQSPLKVEGCWASGAAGTELRKKLLARPGIGLRAVEMNDQVVALGTDPPWVDGAIFLGRVGHLYLPTLWQPNLPSSWIEAKLEKLGDPPWIILPSGQALGLSKAMVIP
jgi:MoxR-vWA-beta-propeller ternary system domain bpX5